MTVSINGYTLGSLAYVCVVINFSNTAPADVVLAKLSIPASEDTVLNGIVKSDSGGVVTGNYIKIDTNGYIYQWATAVCKEIVTFGVYPIK